MQDKDNMYSDAQVVVATGPSTNAINHRKDRDIGIGNPMAVVYTVRAIDAASADETYTAQLQVDDTDAFGSPVSIGGLATIPRTSPVGKKFVTMIPPDTDFEQFSRVSYTLGGTTPSLTLDAELKPWWAIQNDAAYADAVTIG